MTICPIAAAVSCKNCPAYRVCPATSILGDQKKTSDKIESNKPQPEKNSAS